MHLFCSNMDIKLNWDDLRYLVALDRYGGLKQAADHLGTSHQTVSRRLKSLERDLAVRLLDMTGRRWKLTHKGHEILALAQQMEITSRDIRRASHIETEEFVGRVGISSVSWGMDLIVMPALRAIQAEYPEISFDLVTDDGIQSIEAGDIDVALRFTQAPLPDLIGTEIGAVHLRLYGLKSHARAFTKGQMDATTLIRLADDRAHPNRWDDRDDGPKRTVFVNDLQTLLLAVQNGLGVAVLPTVVAQNVPALVCIQTQQVEGRHSAWVLRHQDSRRSKKVRLVEREIVKIGKQVLGSK